MDKKGVTFFNDTSRSYLAEYDKVTTDGHSFRARREKVLELVEQKPGKALDIACGPGILVKGLLEKGYSVVGADAAPEMVARAKELYAGEPQVELEVADVYALPYPDETFDVVTALGLVEYLDDEAQALEEMIRVTKKGGALIITYPNLVAPWRLWNQAFLSMYRAIRPPKLSLTRASGHPLTHREYREQDVLKTLTDAGLVVEKVSYYNFKLIPYPVDQWLPRVTVWQSTLFENSLPNFLRKVGTGFIIRARK